MRPASERVDVIMRTSDLDQLDLALLRQRKGEKWALYPGDVLPAWVAEMDFPLADPIRQALQAALDRGDLGYPMPERPSGLPTVFAERMMERFGWHVEPHRVELLTDVVQGIYVALQQFSSAGDGVVVQTPIYPPFLMAVHEMQRMLVENPLVPGRDRYELDIDSLRRVIDPHTRILLLCNPHNPTGRVLQDEELEAIAEIALSRKLVVVSDEIHADLVYPGTRHRPFATLGPEVEARTITLASATKAFNIAGLRCAVAVFGSSELMNHFLECPRHLRGGVGILGIEATLAAWRHAQPWLDHVLAYLDDNRRFISDFARAQLPGIGYHMPEAGYLAWLDCRQLVLDPSPHAFFLSKARVGLGNGTAFGAPGEGFVRLTFATSRDLLTRMLERMTEALRARGA